MADQTSDSEIERILKEAKTIALVGASPDRSRASHRVGQYLVRQGYRVIPVNPVIAGQELFGDVVVATLSEAAEADMVDVFRRSEHVAAIVEEALELPKVQTIWTQLGVRDDAAADRARARGIAVVQDRCPAIEIPRLGLGV